MSETGSIQNADDPARSRRTSRVTRAGRRTSETRLAAQEEAEAEVGRPRIPAAEGLGVGPDGVRLVAGPVHLDLGDRCGGEDADPIQLAAAPEHLGEAVEVGRGGNVAAGRHLAVLPEG